MELLAEDEEKVLQKWKEQHTIEEAKEAEKKELAMTTIKIKPKNQEKKKVIIDNQIEDDDNLIKVDQEDIK